MKTISADNSILVEEQKMGFLNADLPAASGSGTFESIIGFAINKILLIGEFGNEKSEILKTHAATAPTGSTVTFAANTTFQHPASTPVYIIDYDQIEVSWSATVGGSKTVLATINIQADQLATLYTDTTETSGYYFIRFKETIGNTFSDYSDPIPYTGWTSRQVGSIIQYALKRNKQPDFTDNVDHDFCIDEINNCLVDMTKKLKRWNELQEFDYVLGYLEQGWNEFDAPPSMYQYSNESILNLRIAGGTPMTYLDKEDFDAEFEDIHSSTVAAIAGIGATEIELDDVADFDDSGTVLINGMTIEYTDRDTVTNVLSGIPATGVGAIDTAIAVDDQVWQNAEEGTPTFYTIYEGKIKIGVLPDSTLVGRTVMIDFWKEVSRVDTDGDTIDVTRADAVKYWLTWMIRNQLKNDGKKDLEDGDYKSYLIALKDAVDEQAHHGQQFRWTPKLNRIRFRK